MHEIINFFNCPFFIIIGGILTLLMIIGFGYVGYLVIRGVAPIWYRLGMGLSKGRIAIFASTDEYSSLRDMLIDSKLFKAKNIKQVHEDDLDKAEGAHVFLVHWKACHSYFNKILSLKKDNIALVIYAPQDEGKIDAQPINDINSKRNSVIVNFRGRLLNDILTSLMVRSYERK